jgi:hypothetical protein
MCLKAQGFCSRQLPLKYMRNENRSWIKEEDYFDPDNIDNNNIDNNNDGNNNIEKKKHWAYRAIKKKVLRK